MTNEVSLTAPDELSSPKAPKPGKDSPFNTTQVLAICFGEVMEGLYVTLPYTIAAYMVRRFLHDSPLEPKALEAKIGQLTGLLAAAFCAMQFCTTLPLGLLSNRVGRKPVMILSQLSGMASCIAFGLSPNYAAALTTRIIGGALNATGGTVKVMLSESCAAQQLPRAMSYQALGWGLGTILGPAIGGSLSSPCDRLASGSALCQPDSLLLNRPYLLPCLVGGAMGSVAVFLSIFVMKESLPRMTGAAQYAPVMELASWDPQEAKAQTDETRTPSPCAMRALQETNDSSVRSGDLNASTPPCRPAVSLADSENLTPSSNSWHSRQSKLLHDQGADLAAAAQNRAMDEETARLVVETAPAPNQSPSGKWYKDRQVCSSLAMAIWISSTMAWLSFLITALQIRYASMLRVILSLALYTGMAALFNYLDELRPICASAPAKEGGLGLTTDVLAYSLVFGGIIFIVYSYAAFERVHEWMGTLWTSRSGILGIVPSAVCSVLPSLFTMHPALVQLSLFAAMFCNSIADTNAYVGCSILINNAAPQALAEVNSSAQTFSALVRGIGPACSGIMWGLAVHSGLPQHQFLPFAFVAIVAIILQQCFVFIQHK